MIAPKVVSHVTPSGRDYSGTTAPDLITSVPTFTAPTCATCQCACTPEADGPCNCGCLACGCGDITFKRDQLGRWKEV